MVTRVIRIDETGVRFPHGPQMETSDHAVLIIQGLNDRPGKYDWLIKLGNWEANGFVPVVYRPSWHDREAFNQKLEKAVREIEKMSHSFRKISIVGCSAGGSFAGNLFYKSGKVHKMVNNCGRLKVGPKNGFRGFKERTISSNAFAQSVIWFENEVEPHLSLKQRKRIMTIRPFLGDELVPGETVVINGALNRVLYCCEHGITIATALIFPNMIQEFFKND